MKRMFYFVCASALVASCTKSKEVIMPSSSQPRQVATMLNDSLPPDIVLAAPTARMRSRGHTQIPPDVAVLYLNFDGASVSNTFWNSSTAPIVATASKLNYLQRLQVVLNVAEHYVSFKVKVTMNKYEFDHAPGNKVECIVTNYSPSIYPIAAGGVAFLNSMWFDVDVPNPCFVFCDLLNNNPKYVGDAASHEFGHATAGLAHDSQWNGCTQTVPYVMPFGTGPLSWGSIMGNSYAAAVSTFTDGAHAYCNNGIQQEIQILGLNLGFKDDEVGDDFAHAKRINVTWFGATQAEVLNSSTDIDMFFAKGKPRDRYRVSIISGGTTDFKVVVYDKNGTAIQTIEKNGMLHVPFTMLKIPKPQEGFYIAVMRQNDDPSSYIPLESSTGSYTMLLTSF